MPAFDPYHKWLGIPPAEQPPNHYRLLGVGLFEQDADVIESAADRQMVHVQSQKHGPHAEQSQRLLNELAAARLCLLDPRKKAAYDAELHGKAAPRHVARAIAPAAPPPAPAVPPAPRPLPAMRESAAGAGSTAWSPAASSGGAVLVEEGVILEQQGVEVRQPLPTGRYAGRRKKSQLPLILASLGGGAAVLAVVIVLATKNNDRAGDEDARSQKSPAKVTEPKTSPATNGPGRPLPDTPALWNPEPEKPPREKPTTNPPKTNPGGTRPGPVRLPDPIILGPDGKPKKVGTTPAGEDDDGSAVDPPPTASPPQPTPPASRLPVPSNDELKSALRELRENYAEDFKSLNTDEKKSKLAEKLFKAAALEKKGSPRRYAMWETTRDLSQEVGIPQGAANAAGALAEEFDIADPVQVVANTFYEASRNARTVEGRDAAVEYAPFLLGIALRHDHFVGARRVVLAGKAVATSSPAAKRGPLNDEFDAMSRGVTILETQFRNCATARESLQNSPDDDAAHQTVGLYVGLLKYDWPAGAPHLAQAEDAVLKELGAKEVAAISGKSPPPSSMTALAEGWLDWAKQQNSPHKEAALLRARHWRQTALGRLRGDDKKRAQAAIESIDALLEPLEFATFLDKLQRVEPVGSKQSTAVDMTNQAGGRISGKRKGGISP